VPDPPVMIGVITTGSFPHAGIGSSANVTTGSGFTVRTAESVYAVAQNAFSASL